MGLINQGRKFNEYDTNFETKAVAKERKNVKNQFQSIIKHHGLMVWKDCRVLVNNTARKCSQIKKNEKEGALNWNEAHATLISAE